MSPPVTQWTTSQLTFSFSPQLRGLEGVVSQPAPPNILQTGPGLNTSAAGTMRDEMTPRSEGGRNAQRGRELSIGRQQIGERQPPRDGETAIGAPTPSYREPRYEATTSTHEHSTEEPDLDSRREMRTARLRNTPQGNLRQPRRQKQSMKIASLNINGNGPRASDKWGAISNMMRKRKVAILAAQETHPTLETQESLQRRFRSLHFFHSADPNEPGSRNGVTIVLNKDLIKTTNVLMSEVVDGRVMVVSIPWNGEDTLQIMNVYALVKTMRKRCFGRTCDKRSRTPGSPTRTWSWGTSTWSRTPRLID